MMNMGECFMGDGSARDRMNVHSAATETPQNRLASAHGCFSQMDLLQRRSVELAERVQSLVNRLVGPVPEKDGGNNPNPPICGLLDVVQVSCIEPNRQMARALDALDRLEAALPQQ